MLVDAQRVDAEQPQPRRDGQPALARADDQHRRFAVGEGLLLGAAIRPVRPAELARGGAIRGGAR